MLRVGQECKAGLCCYAGVCYKNTTLHFQSSNAERAPAPPNSCQAGNAAEGPGPGPRRWELQRRFLARCAGGRHPTAIGLGGARPELLKGRRTRRRAARAEETLETPRRETPQGRLLPRGRQAGGGMEELLTGSHAAGYFASVPFTKPNQPPLRAGSEEGAGPTTAGHPSIRRRDPRKGPQDAQGPNWSDTRWWPRVPQKRPASGLETMEGQGVGKDPHGWEGREGEAKRPYKF